MGWKNGQHKQRQTDQREPGKVRGPSFRRVRGSLGTFENFWFGSCIRAVADRVGSTEKYRFKVVLKTVLRRAREEGPQTRMNTGLNGSFTEMGS